MVGRHIQRIEIMELVFNIRSFGNFKTHFAENRRNFLINFADRMNAPLLFGADVVINHGQTNPALFDVEFYTRLCLGFLSLPGREFAI